MKPHIFHLRLYWLCLIVFLVQSCKEENAPVADMRPRVTVITSMYGLGDMGYNDKVMSGIMKFYNSHDIRMNMFHPLAMDEVKQSVEDWYMATSSMKSKSLLVLADNAYEGVLRSLDLQLSENQKILIFESGSKDLPEGVITFDIDRYGVSYLAGCMAMNHISATVVAAMPDDYVLGRAIEGFKDGYCSEGNNDFNVVYIADDDSGFRKPNEAYKIASELPNTFILPLAGGSNSGIYKYSRENIFYLPLIAGMDVDCSYLSPRLPYSIVLHIDELINEYLTAWIEDKEIEPYHTYGLSTGKTDIVISNIFFDNLEVWEDYYFSPDYWSNMYVKYKNKAISVESEYENN